MTKNVIKILLLMMLPYANLNAQDLPVYEGTDLGLTYTPQSSTFKIWSPVAKKVTLRFYKEGLPTPDNKDLVETIEMTKGEKGEWSATAQGDKKGLFYTFQVQIAVDPASGGEGMTMKEVPDVYAKTVGVNGVRGHVVDLKSTNPSGWDSDRSPVMKYKTDAILYELHVRDASIAESSGIKNKGKFLGLTETGRKFKAGKVKVTTGLDHIKELGVTHVHLLPSYDFFTVDETKYKDASYKKYNWGYDPLNYNTPEGSYSTNPMDGGVRIKEMKEMIMAMHKAGLRVVMDVVYNHTMFGEESYFHQAVPNYYHRMTPEGKFSNASGCGNETASEKPMMRKFMLESLKYWAEEFHIDGFRFDLMAIHDIETMNLISKTLHAIKPDILLYGEGWTSGDSPLPEVNRSLKKYTFHLDKIAAFSDDMRDGIKGSVFDHKDKGFVSGKKGMEESIKFGIVAATKHPQVSYAKVNYSKEPWATEPFQCINYPECHDNHTLWDRLANSNTSDTEGDKIKMHKLAQTIVLTSQGIPFLHAGTEYLRTKKGEENSFDKSDEINQMDWARKAQYNDVFKYFKEIIALRKAHPAFRMPSTELITQHLKFLDTNTEGVVAYTLNGKAVNDKWKNIVVIFNANKMMKPINIPTGKWKVVLDGETVNEKKPKDFKGAQYFAPPLGAVILAEY
jgi:pullulanase